MNPTSLKKKAGNQHPSSASATPSTTRYLRQANSKGFLMIFRAVLACDISFLAKNATSPLPQHLTTDYLDL